MARNPIFHAAIIVMRTSGIASEQAHSLGEKRCPGGLFTDGRRRDAGTRTCIRFSELDCKVFVRHELNARFASTSSEHVTDITDQIQTRFAAPSPASSVGDIAGSRGPISPKPGRKPRGTEELDRRQQKMRPSERGMTLILL